MLGAGPAGSAASIAACQAGALVRVFEKSVFPRHKVCGEFLSPEVTPILEKLGAAASFFGAKPHVISRLAFHFPGVSKQGRLPEPGWGLSRYCLDQLLLDRAVEAGANLERRQAPEPINPPMVVSTGRRFQGKRGGRLFGFKAHYAGPPTDSVELFFFRGCYVGVNSVESGITNVCGLGPEEVLGECGFEPDSLLAAFEPLRDRLTTLRRSMPWLTTGPLYFREQLTAEPRPGCYYAGDQLSFVDPFTGTGMLSALLTGAAAGRAAATGQSPAAYLSEAGKRLGQARHVSSFIRWSIEKGLAARLVKWVPAGLLVNWTRPRAQD